VLPAARRPSSETRCRAVAILASPARVSRPHTRWGGGRSEAACNSGDRGATPDADQGSATTHGIGLIGFAVRGRQEDPRRQLPRVTAGNPPVGRVGLRRDRFGWRRRQRRREAAERGGWAAGRQDGRAASQGGSFRPRSRRPRVRSAGAAGSGCGGTRGPRLTSEPSPAGQGPSAGSARCSSSSGVLPVS